MTTVTAYTAARMKEIEDSAIIDGDVVGDNLILIRFDATTINAGNVRGPIGPTGPAPSNIAYGVLGYTQSIIAQGPITTITDLITVNVTVAAGRRIKITGQGSVYGTVANDSFLGKIMEGGTVLGVWYDTANPVSGRNVKQTGFAIISPSTGAHIYKLTIERTIGTGSANLTPTASNPLFILVEDIGLA